MYRTNEHAHIILKRVMSLHLIPPEKIHKMFKYLEKSMARLFEKDNVLDGKKHDQEMVRQFFRTCELIGLMEMFGHPKNGPFLISM